jgi:hypothetical protein
LNILIAGHLHATYLMVNVSFCRTFPGDLLPQPLLVPFAMLNLRSCVLYATKCSMLMACRRLIFTLGDRLASCAAFHAGPKRLPLWVRQCITFCLCGPIFSKAVDSTAPPAMAHDVF